MALFNTDWTKELEQVDLAAKKIIDNDISPLIDQKISIINSHADELMQKASVQVDSLAKDMLKELERQRQKLVADVIQIGLTFSPLIDQKISVMNTLADEQIQKASVQVDSLAKDMLKEIELQRQQLIADVTKMGLIFLLGFTLSGALLIWLFFFFKSVV